jgi:hypothetical protein
MSLRHAPTLSPAMLAANKRNAQKSTGPAHRSGQAPHAVERAQARLALQLVSGIAYQIGRVYGDRRPGLFSSTPCCFRKNGPRYAASRITFACSGASSNGDGGTRSQHWTGWLRTRATPGKSGWILPRTQHWTSWLTTRRLNFSSKRCSTPQSSGWRRCSGQEVERQSWLCNQPYPRIQAPSHPQARWSCFVGRVLSCCRD